MQSLKNTKLQVLSLMLKDLNKLNAKLITIAEIYDNVIATRIWSCVSVLSPLNKNL